MVLRLWVAIRLNTKSTNIVGPERLGMLDDILDDTHPTPGRIPIPPSRSLSMARLSAPLFLSNPSSSLLVDSWRRGFNNAPASRVRLWARRQRWLS
jgi:hypothetical protein